MLPGRSAQQLWAVGAGGGMAAGPVPLPEAACHPLIMPKRGHGLRQFVDRKSQA
ncbi:hypothetical protein KPL78_25715 [Roseomonas sp. HJA6]|uniref:Uncharacterized protein n=1 Tax=Roseomonas alba TaxID=2846776 RepID=A0ABS7AG59_9PROT|nr:hypothetical protein [Neoroseomonas alba]